MPTTFSSAGFQVQSVVARTQSTLRVRFTYDPRQSDPNAIDDALNPLNYTVTGAHLALPVSVQVTASDPQSVDVTLNVPLAAGVWSLIVSATVEASDGTALGAAQTTTFSVESTLALALPNGGATSDGPLETLQQHLPFEGLNWDAILAAIATGDQTNIDNGSAMFDQLFLVSASGSYLERRAAAVGVSKPVNVGMSDILFRRLAIRMSTQLTTAESLLELLDIFYGPETVSAYMDSVEEPFALVDGWTFSIDDGHDVAEVVFSEDDFERVGVASAVETAVAITRECLRAGLPVVAEAVPTPDSTASRVRIRSTARGLGSTLRVTGGLAQNELQFPTKLEVVLASATVTVTEPEVGTARYAFSIAGTPPLLDVREGDYVNITSTSLSSDNRGTFVVTAVRVVWGGASWTQYFEVDGDPALEAGLAVSAGDFTFFRPTKVLVGGGLSPVVANTSSFDVRLPATTRLVGRTEGTAAYLQARRLVDVSSVVVRDDGDATVTTAVSHGLTAGDHVILDDVRAALTAPATVAGVPSTAGNPGTTDVSQTSLWSTLRSDLTARAYHGAALMSNGDIVLAGGYNGGYLTTASRFRIASEAVLSSGAAKGRTQYTYNWIATASLGTAQAEHTLDGLFGNLAERALLTGGRNGGGTLSTALIYSGADNAWTTVLNGTLTARYGHKSVRIEDVNGDDLVYLTYGLSDPTTTLGSVQLFTSADGGTLSTMTSPAGKTRHRHAVCATGSRSWVVVGGATLPGVVPLRDSVAYDQATDTFSTPGPLALARYDHALVQLRTGVVMAIGGKGRNLVHDTTDRVLHECEILDLSTMRWRRAGRLRTARQNPAAVVVEGKVYVFGGTDAAGAAISTAEVYDAVRGTWSTLPAATSAAVAVGAGVTVTSENLVFEHGGVTPAPAYVDTARLLVPGANTITPKASLRREVVVSVVPTSTTFEFEVETGQPATLGTGSLEKMSAAAGTHAGPFVWDPIEGIAVTDTATELATALTANSRHRALIVDSTAGFPDEPGWLAIAFGTSVQLAPVRYLGVGSGTELLFDYSLLIPHDIPVDAKVTLLSQREGYEPAETDLGAFYLTASSAGRVAAQKFLADASAGGMDYRVTVDYPGDIGLAGAGLPASGVARLADKVHVWGGDTPDEELAAAREES